MGNKNDTTRLLFATLFEYERENRSSEIPTFVPTSLPAVFSSVLARFVPLLKVCLPCTYFAFSFFTLPNVIEERFIALFSIYKRLNLYTFIAVRVGTVPSSAT